jgi:hypothetical protein
MPLVIAGGGGGGETDGMPSLLWVYPAKAVSPVRTAAIASAAAGLVTTVAPASTLLLSAPAAGGEEAFLAPAATLLLVHFR